MISDITYEDIVISGRVNAWQTLPSSPIRMTEFYHPAREHSGAYAVIANLTFRNIVAEAAPMPNEPCVCFTSLLLSSSTHAV